MSGKKKGLGRGLSALFGDEKPKSEPQEIKHTNKVLISDLSRNPYQPRQSFVEEKQPKKEPTVSDETMLFDRQQRQMSQ